MICEDNSIINMTGTPYNAPLNLSHGGWWDFMASSHYNPMYFFLDTIWSKLSYKYNLPPVIFGVDLETPKMTPFLSCQITKQGNLMGWNYWYHEFDKDSLDSINGTSEWQPIFLDEIQFQILSILCNNNEIDFSKEPQIEDDASKIGYTSLDALIILYVKQAW